MTLPVAEGHESTLTSNLWEAAILKVKKHLPSELTDVGSSDVDTATQLQLICQVALNRQEEEQKRQWRIQTKKGKTVVLRDLWGNVLGWAKKFQAVGDVAIQADAGYASLPWVHTPMRHL